MIKKLNDSMAIAWKKLPKKRIAMFLIVFGLCATTAVFAQSTGSAGFSKAQQDIESYRGPVQKLMYAIAAVIAIVGAFNVYFKMQNGDQDVKKTIMMTIGGCVAFVAMAAALPAFFGYN